MAQTPRVNTLIDSKRVVGLTKNIHPLARPEFDRGAVDPALKLGYVTMVLKPTAAQHSDLQDLLLRQQDQSSAEYHNWLTPEQFGNRFGLAIADISAIQGWLAAEGLHIEDTARGRNWIAFSGSAGQIDRVFHTDMHRFLINGKWHYANTANPSVPAALADAVGFFRGLDDFEPEPPEGIHREIPMPGFTSSTGVHSMAPDDFALIYDVKPLYDSNIYGDGQSVAILGRTDIDLPGYQMFRSIYGLSATVPVMHLVGTDPGMSASDLGEAMLDLEWSGAVARNSTIIYVYATSIYTAAQEAVDKNLAPVISSSYSSCEPDAADTLRYLAQQANAQGITWLVVTNDAGAAACEKHNDRQLAATGFAISYPASIPEITAVGGTMFNDGSGTYWTTVNSVTGASVLSYIPEVGWNENSANGIFASGGGASIFYPKPLWQNGPGVPADKARDIPDLSMAAASHDAYRTYHNGLNYLTSGTSAGTPAFAGIMALLNQYQVKNGLQPAPGMGNINPELYRLAQTYPAAFHDVTTGNNFVPCVQSSPDCLTGSFGYTAGPGYDQVTGLGSVDVNNLITHWNQNGAPTKTTAAAAAATIAFGAKPQVMATVAAVKGVGVPTGTVSFLVPGGPLGTTDLGSAPLTVAGNVANASITVDPNQLALGANSVEAVYSGDANFDVSSATTTVTVTPPANASAIVAQITPNPAYASASTLGVRSWYSTITLIEQAGIAATLTGFTIDGTDEGSRLAMFFSGTKIAAHGTLTGSVVTTGLTTPVSRVFTFSGVDANGNTWNQQITVLFIAQLLQPEIVLTGAPATVQQNASASASCQWLQRLNLQETGGYSMQLFKFLAGTKDLTSQISQYFGTTVIAPFGALQATMCVGGSAPPAATTYEVDGMSDSGATFRTTFATSYMAAPASPASLAIAQSSVALSLPSNSGSATAPLSVSIGGNSSWTAVVFPSNATTSWLTIAPGSGSGSGTITLTASAAGQAPGVYRATVIVQGSTSVPQFVEVPVTFTVGASPGIAIAGVANAASFQTNAAPGMILSVFGTGLAPGIQLAGVLPLPIAMQGVSATVNGVAAPLYYVSPGQINLQVPYETGARTAVVGINNNGKIASFPFTTVPAAPGIFVQNGNLVPGSSGKPGGVLTLYMTGEGDVSPALITGASPNPATALDQLPQARLPVTVTVGGVKAAIQFAAIPAFLVGVTQINFTIPANVPPGLQPVVVTSNGVASSAANITVIAQ